LQTSLA